MSQSRQLAAIMFTDIVGYTALMDEDEQQAFELLKKNRLVQRPIIESHNGKWLKEMGDGVLASFSTVTEAVFCAKAIQKACEDQSDLKLRIGIHQGEVVFDGEDVFGSGVNIASRLEPLAPIGGILVSESVHNNLINKKDVESTYVGEKQLKNVKKPVKVYQVHVEGEERVAKPEITDLHQQLSTKPNNFRKIAFAAAGVLIVLLLSYFLYSNFDIKTASGEPKLAAIDKSVVVMPFTNMSNDPDQEYFSDGMMEEILNHLVKIEELKVISRTTAMQYKGTSKTLQEIAQELRVATVLEGSVRKNGDQVRITVQLIEGDTDTHLWSESYDRELKNIFKVQSDVAQQVAQVLKAEVSPELQERIETVPTEALDAYDNYLKGNESYWESWKNFDTDKVYESIEYFQKAIKIDEEFSIGYTGLGRSYWRLAGFLNKPELWNKSKQYLTKAINLDPYNGWAYGEMAVVNSNWDWDSTKARTNLDIALKLMPNDQNVYLHYFWHSVRIGIGDFERAKWALKNLERLNPIFEKPSKFENLGLLLAQKEYVKIVSIADEHNLTENLNATLSWVLFDSFLSEHQYKKARIVVDYMKESVKIKSSYFLFNAVLGAKEGNRSITKQMLDSLEMLSEKAAILNTEYAVIYAALGEKEVMYNHLDTTLKRREPRLHSLNMYSVFNAYQEDPIFKEIVGKLWIPLDKNDSN